MKVVLILGIIALSVIGFFIFLMYISKQDTKKPIEQVKEKDKNEAAFIKQRQALYKETSGQREVEVVTPLKEENRGVLFEKAIQRKRNNYRDDDEEYEARKKEKEEREKKEKEELETKEELERIATIQEKDFEPKPVPFSFTKKEEEQEEKEEELSKEKEEEESSTIAVNSEPKQEEYKKEEENPQQEDDNFSSDWEEEKEEDDEKEPIKENLTPPIPYSKEEKTHQEDETPKQTIIPTIQSKEEPPQERLYRNDVRNNERTFRNITPQISSESQKEELSLEERKKNIEQYELEQRLEFEKFVKEILAEAEDINRRREAFIKASYSMSS